LGKSDVSYIARSGTVKRRSRSLSAKGAKFDQKKFPDFILAQGWLPPDLMREAVTEDFVPMQK
jgi:uncharacterized protein (DUF885 family)